MHAARVSAAVFRAATVVRRGWRAAGAAAALIVLAAAASAPAAAATGALPDAAVQAVPAAASAPSAAGASGAWAASAASSAASAAPAHKPLRKNVVIDGFPVPTEPEVFSGYAGAPPFTVVPRKGEILLYPCSMCHNLLPPTNTKVRKLLAIPDPKAAPHQAMLRHGGGRFWCLECHYLKDREFLRTLDNKKLSFDESPRLCGQCHGEQHRDWAFGAHGKRVAGWTGERQLYACTHCHDPHDPTVKPRAPSPPPRVRDGLLPMAHAAAASAPPGDTASRWRAATARPSTPPSGPAGASSSPR